MENWDKVSAPPSYALSKIKGGRLSGMTDIKPQWRVLVMTQVYGMCGVGWKFEVTKLWTEQGSENQVFAFANINLYTSNKDTWSEPIPGHGGNMLVTKEKKGLYSSDEGFKMAITDALSTAMKMIGVGADIYMGAMNSSKYTEQQTTKKPDPFLEEMKGYATHEKDIYWQVLGQNGFGKAADIPGNKRSGILEEMLLMVSEREANE
jgi:hypothetical protein